MTKKNKNISPLYTYDKPKSTISEKFRGIRSNIMFSNANAEITDVIITSEKPAAGKSTIAANIAITYAQAGYKSLLIDGDMRKPTQHYIFDVTNNNGLSNFMLDRAMYQDAIKETFVENLFVLTSGPIPPNPSELIGSEKFKTVYQQLKQDFDFIVIDTPPITSVTDAQLYATNVASCILVIDSEKNDKNEVKKAKYLIETSGAKVIGVVLNKMPKDKSSNYYYYYGDDSND